MSESDAVDTWYAPPERCDAAILARQSGYFKGQGLASTILDTLTDPVALLNSNLQIVYANPSFLHLAGRDHFIAIIGLRPGEVLRCIHAESGPYGCGTAQTCGSCGAVVGILEGQRGGACQHRMPATLPYIHRR